MRKRSGKRKVRPFDLRNCSSRSKDRENSGNIYTLQAIRKNPCRRRDAVRFQLVGTFVEQRWRRSSIRWSTPSIANGCFRWMPIQTQPIGISKNYLVVCFLARRVHSNSSVVWAWCFKTIMLTWSASPLNIEKSKWRVIFYILFRGSLESPLNY